MGIRVVSLNRAETRDDPIGRRMSFFRLQKCAFRILFISLLSIDFNIISLEYGSYTVL